MKSSSNPERELDPVLLAEQRVLAGSLTRLGRTLQKQDRADPVLAMRTTLTMLTTMRTWLDLETLLASAHAGNVSRQQLEAWESHLESDLAYLGELHQAISAELHMSLRERNKTSRGL